MRTITKNIYKFEELTDNAKEKALENLRYIFGDDACHWAIDDCYLFAPDLNDCDDDLFMQNNRSIYYSLDRDRFIDISKGMVILDSQKFLAWIGIPNDIDVSYAIGKDTIEFEDYPTEFSDVVDSAIDKFESHCRTILQRIERSYDYYLSDENMIEMAELNDLEFYENGDIL